MTEARANILSRLRRHASADAAPDLQRATERYDWPPDERIQRFTDRMTAVRTEVHRVSGDQWIDKLRELVAAKGLGNLLYAPATEHGRRIETSLGEDSLALLPYGESIEAWKAALFHDVAASVTGCRGGIAETGSLILWPDSHEPRLMSLVPPVHFVLLEATRLYSTFAEALYDQQWAADMPTNALLISGPSKTADIEQTLAYGVHGPKELVVLIIE
jgi:L-lactate dehydrogenase complex protein LldG